MRKRLKVLGWLIILLLVDGLFFGLVNPTKAPAIVVVLGFALLVLTIYVGIDVLLRLIARAVPIGERTRLRIRAFVTTLLGVLLAMQSIGQLAMRDLFALVPLVVVLLFYLSYQNRSRQRAS